MSKSEFKKALTDRDFESHAKARDLLMLSLDEAQCYGLNNIDRYHWARAHASYWNSALIEQRNEIEVHKIKAIEDLNATLQNISQNLSKHIFNSDT